MTTITQLSPGVAFREIDLTAFVPNVGTNQGAFVGQFTWGPVMDYRVVSSATDLANVFGKPTDANYIDWFSAANYLAYTNNLLVTRVVDEESAFNAVAGIVYDDHDIDPNTPQIPKLYDNDVTTSQRCILEVTAKQNNIGYYTFDVNYISGTNLLDDGDDLGLLSGEYNIQFYKEGMSKYIRSDLSYNYSTGVAGDPGAGNFGFNSADIATADNLKLRLDIKNNKLDQARVLSQFFADWTFEADKKSYIILDKQTPAIPAGLLIKNYNHFKSMYCTNKNVMFAARYPGSRGNGLIISMADRNTFSTWEYNYYFDTAPGTSAYVKNLGGSDDEIHVIIIDGSGVFSGEKGTVLERFAFLSKANDARSLDGAPIFYGNVLNDQSYYVWYLGAPLDTDLAVNQCVKSVDIEPVVLGYLGGQDYIPTGDTITFSAAPVGGVTATGFLVVDPTSGAITGVRLTNGGSGYLTAPTVTIVTTGGGDPTTYSGTHSGGDIATLQAQLTGDSVTNVIVTAAGANYKSATIIDFPQPDNGGYRAVATLTFGNNGTIEAVTMRNNGTEYGSWDEIGFEIISREGSGFDAVILPENVSEGRILGITINKNYSEIEFQTGTGYDDDNTSIVFSNPPAGSGGIAAKGDLVIENGKITQVKIIRPGSGYTKETPATFQILKTFGSGSPTGSGFSGKVVMEDVNADDWDQSAVDVTSGNPRKFAFLGKQYTRVFKNGSDGLPANANEIIFGWELYRDAEETDVGLLFLGAPGGPNGGYDVHGDDYRKTIIQYVIDNVCTYRKDCVCFISPKLNDVLNRKQGDAAAAVVKNRNALNRSTSYAVMDSGWKLQYDLYNDKYRWIPLNADVAGLCAQTDMTNDPWWSPAGHTRGNIKNCISLAFNPNKTSRDELYKNSINPVVTFTGDGTILYGDKTLQTRQSAFSWINVRRLFIVLEKAISKAAKYFLFEFNDDFTRKQFLTMVVPYLEMVKNRRGLYDYHVVCDDTNNTPEIIDRGEFVASIFLKPARSINFITLNFVAVRTGVEFSEVVNLV